MSISGVDRVGLGVADQQDLPVAQVEAEQAQEQPASLLQQLPESLEHPPLYWLQECEAGWPAIHRSQPGSIGRSNSAITIRRRNASNRSTGIL
jgi:hypothetical protein